MLWADPSQLWKSSQLEKAVGTINQFARCFLIGVLPSFPLHQKGQGYGMQPDSMPWCFSLGQLWPPTVDLEVSGTNPDRLSVRYEIKELIPYNTPKENCSGATSGPLNEIAKKRTVGEMTR